MLHFNRAAAAQALAVVTLLEAGCDTSSRIPPLAMAEYTVKATDIVGVEAVLDRIAEKYELRPFRKDRSQMAALSSGNEAFFTALYLEDQPLLVATNAGTGITLHVSALRHPRIASTEVLDIYSEFTTALEKELGLKRVAGAT